MTARKKTGARGPLGILGTAITTTPQMILNRAYAKSKRNTQGKVATEATELVEIVHAALQALYQVGARVNPIFFSEGIAVSFASNAWPRPPKAESIFRIDADGGTLATPAIPAGTEIAVVPFDDRDAESGRPAVYEMGQRFWPANNPLDPTGGTLTFWCSVQPVKATTLSAFLDTLWTEQFNELLVYEVAIHLEIKDERPNVDRLVTQRDMWLKRFIAFLEHATISERRRFDVRRIHTNTTVPITSILAGGSSVTIPAAG